MSSTEVERQERWQEHFAEVFAAKVLECVDDARTSSLQVVENHNFHPTHSGTLNAIKALGTNKAVGPDEIPALLLQAGDFPLAQQLHQIELRAIRLEQFPTAWKGGRLVDLLKHKGDASVCGMSRGLLIADHMAKRLYRSAQGLHHYPSY